MRLGSSPKFSMQAQTSQIDTIPCGQFSIWIFCSICLTPVENTVSLIVLNSFDQQDAWRSLESSNAESCLEPEIWPAWAMNAHPLPGTGKLVQNCATPAKQHTFEVLKRCHRSMSNLRHPSYSMPSFIISLDSPVNSKTSAKLAAVCVINVDLICHW